ncbi:transposase [Yersinia enterocolitica]|uniref:transposase n=1 Tax=Yersinia enterocolitica TaxID=630 RepID=UPI0029A1A2DF|nr:DDE-type integrase/transposase/recombinase [Yersinia enterocolitica]
MLVSRNSVWEIEGLDGLLPGRYRVLECYSEQDSIIVFPLINTKELQKPILIIFSFFLESIKNNYCVESYFPLPFYQLVSDQDIPDSYRKKRDQRYELVSGLLSSPNFLWEFSLFERSKLVSTYAKKKGTYVQNIYRILNQYWRFGQDRNALIPAYKNSGGVGQSRVADEKKRGFPGRIYQGCFNVPIGINTTEWDKNIFIKGMKKFGLKGRHVPLKRVYDQILVEFYREEICNAEVEKRPARLPSYPMFCYWIKKLIPENQIIRKQNNTGYFERNKRSLIGAATDHTLVPGSCFELDATVLDVHIVSDFNRNHVLGRPTLYCVIDKESRMITGLHVSMEYASWRAGRQALVNTFTSKKNYCARFGIDIKEEDWPCHHIPQRLLCDRGEFICNKPEELAVPLIGHLSIAPPYRADLKGIVERRFRILNEELIHELKGTTRGRHYIRGDKDPRQEAIYTLNEVTQLLIDQVLEHNCSILSRLASQTRLLMEADLPPTPFNYWNIHIDKHRHALTVANEDEIRAKLLPIAKVSMTRLGIRLNDDMYYECERDEFDGWKVIARSSGRWGLEARIDQDNSSFIYVRLQPNEGFTRCALMRCSNNLKDQHIADISYFKDWKMLANKNFLPTSESLERYDRRKKIEKNALNEMSILPKISRKSERILNMTERRNEVIKTERSLGGVEQIPFKKGLILATSDNNKESNILEAVPENIISLIQRQRDKRK